MTNHDTMIFVSKIVYSRIDNKAHLQLKRTAKSEKRTVSSLIAKAIDLLLKRKVD